MSGALTMLVAAQMPDRADLLDGQDLNDFGTGLSNASAGLTIKADGTYSLANFGAGAWLTPGFHAGLYELKASGLTKLPGTDAPTGTFDVWMAASSNRSWSISRSSNGTSECSFILQIRRASDSVVLVTATVDLRAQVGLVE